MKSIDKLREWSCHTELHEIANEIEAEIAERYMLLPVDADGMPIRVGDICEMSGEQFEVRQLTSDGDFWWAVDRLGEFYVAVLCRHVKPRTLTDVLCDLFERKMTVTDAEQELRELMEVDA